MRSPRTGLAQPLHGGESVQFAARGLTSEDREATLASWLRTVSENAEAACEPRLERNQRLAWIRLRARALAPEIPGRPGFVVAVEDITEKKQFDTEFLQARWQAT